MATDVPHPLTDVQLLHDYLGKQIDRAGDHLSLDDALSGFQEYYRQIHDLQGKVRQAEASLARGEGRPLDVDSLIGRVRRRLVEQSFSK